MDMPLFLTAALFLLFAVAEWERLPVVARVYLAAATAFALGAFAYPGESITAVIDSNRDGLVYVLAAARIAAFVGVLVSISTFIRERALD